MEKLLASQHVAQAVGVSLGTLPYYEKIGVVQPQRDSNSRRLYTQEDVQKIIDYRGREK